MKKPITIKQVKELERLSRLIDSTSYPELVEGGNSGTFSIDPSIEEVGTEDFFLGYDLEQLIFKLPRTEASIMLFKYLGFNAAEISQILEFKNRRKCYNHTASLKKNISNIKNEEKPI